jgi:hypothetical protein
MAPALDAPIMNLKLLAGLSAPRAHPPPAPQPDAHDHPLDAERDVELVERKIVRVSKVARPALQGAVTRVSVNTGVEVLAQAGARADTLPGIVAHYKRRYGPDWREAFWRQQLRTANLRYQHPELYGPSPCDHVAPPPAGGREGVLRNGAQSGCR